MSDKKRKDRKGFMNFSMPPTFPQDIFQEFGRRASELFPAILTDEDLDDPLQKRMHFERAWSAVRFRYRACSEYNEAFKALLVNGSDLWRAWSADEEQNYKMEQILYQFYMSALSVFDSLGFCLYFIGGMVSSKHFPNVRNPEHITLRATISAFTAAFPHASISNYLAGMKDTEFSKIKKIRNILSHRLIGRRTIRENGSTHSDGTYTHTREEAWYIPGSDEKLIFDEELIQRPFDEATRLLITLISASLEFVESA
jgi:hypothetical protein